MRIIFTMCLLLALVGMATQECCLKMQIGAKKCLQCPADMHLFRDNCIFNIDNCKAYKEGFDCTQCQPNFNLVGNKCIPIPVQPSSDNSIKQQSIVQCTSINYEVLIDYARVTVQILLNADVLCCSVRKFVNGTQFSIAQFDANNKYIQVIGTFHDNLPNQFHFMRKQLNAKPTCQSIKCDLPKNQTVAPNNSSSNNSNQDNHKSNNNMQNNTQKQITGLNQLNYKYLGPEDQKMDRGFKFVDNTARNFHQSQIGSTGKVLSVFSQKKGLSFDYIIYYQSSFNKSVYECRANYQIIKDKVYIISFDRTYIY